MAWGVYHSSQGGTKYLHILNVNNDFRTIGALGGNNTDPTLQF